MSTTTVQIKRLPHGQDIELPSYATSQSAGVDLSAAITNDITIEPGKRVLVPTGMAIALAPGLEAQIRPRSGLALKYGITVLNTPGTIDADYRGEIGVILINLSQESFTITRGMRVAQMLIAPVTTATFELVDDLEQTARGSGGFGSTGLKLTTHA